MLLPTEVVMGALLASHQALLDAGGVYHLILDARLVGIVDINKGVLACRRPVVPEVVMRARWHHRPDLASAVPDGFETRTLDDARWAYATRLDEEGSAPVRQDAGAIGTGPRTLAAVRRIFLRG